VSIVFRILRVLSLVCAFSLALPSLLLAGQGIVVVQSFHVKPYDDALKGFRATCGAEISRVVVTESQNAAVAAVRKEKPALIVAVGMDALEKVREIRNVPIVYVMVLNPRTIVGDQENVTGISMNIPVEKQLAALQKILPEARKVGVLYNPLKTGVLVRKAAATARGMGMELVAREVRSSREIPATLEGMKDSIDVFWLIPDTTVVTPETAEYILLFSHRNRVPVQAVSEKYVEMGALAAVTLDAFALGKQAGEMARRIIAGESPADISRSDASATGLTVNLKVAKKMGVSIGRDILSAARIIQ
jgi:putative tryptophan/tyrosine transport system substrate-binding protein